MKELFELFLSFAKIGATTFGGGIAMLPMLERELINKRNWVTEEEILDYFAVGQCTPGIIAVNTATFVGYKRKGIIGGIAATLGMIFPCLVIIIVIASLLSNYANLPAVQSAFAGIRVCVCVLVLNAFVKLSKNFFKSLPQLIILLLVAAGSLFTDISLVLFVILAAIAGVLIKNISEKQKQESEK